MRFFQYSEFDSPDAPGSGHFMDPHFMELLDRIREQAGFPFIINSGYRTAAHNLAVGGGQIGGIWRRAWSKGAGEMRASPVKG